MTASGKTPNRNTVCFIHGWGFDSRILASLADGLSTDRNVLLVDMPGYGNNRPDILPADINHIADNLISVIPQDGILAGWSLGGMLAIKTAHKFRDRIKAIILLASTPCFVKKQDWPHGVERSLIQGMTDRLSTNVDGVLQEFAGLIARSEISPKQALRELKSLYNSSKPDPDALLVGLNILINEDLRKELSDLECNTMMLLGKRDQLIAASTGSASRAIQPLLQLNEINSAGHAPFLSGKKAVVEIINRFLDDIES